MSLALKYKLKHKINPQIDCVFKRIFGSEKNQIALLDFLNSVLQPKQPIKSVKILNPYNEKESISNKLTIVDIKAQDTQKRQYQIEIQIANHAYLPQRMLYTWSKIYGTQLQTGEDYDQLAPVISIWLLAKAMLKQNDNFHHHFQLCDKQQHFLLTEQCSIHILELSKWQRSGAFLALDHWLYFFKEAHNWTELPNELNTPAMRQAMKTLHDFSEQEREYDRYLRHELALHDKATQEKHMREAKQQLQVAQHELGETQHELDETQNELDETQNELGETQSELGETRQQMTTLQKEVSELKDERRLKDEALHEIKRLTAILKDSDGEIPR